MSEPRYLNIGCGSKPYSNCINIDIRREVRLEVQADLLHLPFRDNIFDKIIANDIVEHFTANQVKILFAECRRVLKMYRPILIKTPYLEAIFENYKRRIFSDREITRRLFGSQDYPGNFHFQIYNPGILIELMKECGFPASIYKEDPESSTNFILESYKQ